MTKEEEVFNERLAIRDENVMELNTLLKVREDVIDRKTSQIKELVQLAQAAADYFMAKKGHKKRMRKMLRIALINSYELHGHPAFNPKHYIPTNAGPS